MNISCSKILVIFLALLISGSIYAQNIDTLVVNNAQYDSILRSDHQEMNTLFYKHHNDALLNNLGPFGSPSYFPTSFLLRSKHLLQKEDRFQNQFFKLKGVKPYSNITFVNGGRKEQFFKFTHLQQFGELFQFGLDFDKLSSPGVYANQEVNKSLFEGFLQYTSKKGNYSIKFSNGIYRDFYQENGGLLDVEEYETKVFSDTRNYAVNLSESNSFIKKYTYALQQRLDLFTISSDSLNKTKFYLKHKVAYTTQQRVFYDNDSTSSYYSNFYLDPVSSIDSVFNNNLSNIGSIGFDLTSVDVNLFGQYDQLNYLQSYGLDTSFSNTYVGLGAHYIVGDFNFDLEGRYGVSGYRVNDIDFDFKAQLDKKKLKVAGRIGYFYNEADLKFTNYISNHYLWDNPDFVKETAINFDFGFKLKKQEIEFKASSKLLTNTLFYDSLAIASQDSGQVSFSSFMLAKDFKVFNFHFRTAIIYQMTSDELLFPIPEFIGRQVLYYQNQLFKGAMKFQFGVSLSYATNYYGYSYAPAIGEFTKQGGSTELGAYPRLDVFVNTYLKRAQIFLKYEHINAGNNIQQSYIAPGYAPMGKSLKFGISWNMFD
jgi:hypothetical protein